MELSVDSNGEQAIITGSGELRAVGLIVTAFSRYSRYWELSTEYAQRAANVVADIEVKLNASADTETLDDKSIIRYAKDDARVIGEAVTLYTTRGYSPSFDRYLTEDQVTEIHAYFPSGHKVEYSRHNDQ